MIDVMGAVYDFVKEFACNGADVPQYDDRQIVRGVLNASVAPDVTDFAVITHTGTIRHGSTVETFPDTLGKSDMLETVEHIVQVDFYSPEPLTQQEVTINRAQCLEMCARSHHGVTYLKAYHLDLLYAENVTNRPLWDETKNYTSCYTVRLHIAETLIKSVADDYFDAISVRTVPAHDPATRPSLEGWLQTEPIDKDHS